MAGRRKSVKLGSVGTTGPVVAEWSLTGRFGTCYKASWDKKSLNLTANGGFIGAVSLRENASEEEASQVASYYLTRWGSREDSGIAPRLG